MEMEGTSAPQESPSAAPRAPRRRPPPALDRPCRRLHPLRASADAKSLSARSAVTRGAGSATVSLSRTSGKPNQTGLS
ncbi:hypothetical protein BRADI_1g43252v3 [Brachypodium distachyon]|uniref:Uncharacterized protein n=1 Tax=Brachypodium distachyon TaxID=15368 RepID=A0A2K2DP31_BRADI|nr:hypothetical protein BRADI_1g43252v3 [Brachypodium distachyon]